jgi:hypothetical protein
LTNSPEDESSYEFETLITMALKVETLEDLSKISHHINLNTIIASLYKGETWKKICLMEKLRIKINRRVADL